MGIKRQVRHEEVPVKVTAWVDGGVAVLVEALNTCHEIITLDSCEGDAKRPAYVLFTTHSQDLCRLVSKLARRFASEGVCAERASISVEWALGSGQPVAELRLSRADVQRVAGKLAELLVAAV